MAVEALPRPAEDVLAPGSTIGIFGGGQLGRMLGIAARRLGYRLAVLDPDPDAPAFPVAERAFVGGYDDVEAALALASESDVITFELEHVPASVAEIVSQWRPVRPGLPAIRVTQDRVAERRWLSDAGARTARWEDAADEDELGAALRSIGYPCRLKTAFGGYDGRGQLVLRDPTDVPRVRPAISRLFDAGGGRLLVEEELQVVAELSVVTTRGVGGELLSFPAAGNRHDQGILVESAAPAPVGDETRRAAQGIAEGLIRRLDVVGTLAVEMFLLADGSLLVNELAPRVHNSGHYTADACRTSQFEQHVRAICGLPLGSVDMAAHAVMLNLLGSGEDRPARLVGVERALADPDVRLTLYDKRRVFERRKMGHITVVARSEAEARMRATTALGYLRWADGSPEVPTAS